MNWREARAVSAVVLMMGLLFSPTTLVLVVTNTVAACQERDTMPLLPNCVQNVIAGWIQDAATNKGNGKQVKNFCTVSPSPGYAVSNREQ